MKNEKMYDRKEEISLPDIFRFNKYNPKGLSDKQNGYREKIDNLIKERFDLSPVNNEAVKNKFLKLNCKLLLTIYF